ncbi:hypothetical protein ACWEQV_20920 [Rhodococcus aetherivorans]
MLAEPESALPPLEAGQRLFICSGTPWNEALADIRAADDQRCFRGWEVDRSYRKGDWILTYLSTRPRVFLSWEQARRDATPTGRIWVESDRSVLFSNLVVVDHIEDRTGLRITAGRSFAGDEARLIRHALLEKLWYPTPWHGLDDGTVCY